MVEVAIGSGTTESVPGWAVDLKSITGVHQVDCHVPALLDFVESLMESEGLSHIIQTRVKHLVVRVTYVAFVMYGKEVKWSASFGVF